MHTTETKQENNNRKTLRFRYEWCLEASNLLQLPWCEIVDDRLLAIKLLNKKTLQSSNSNMRTSIQWTNLSITCSREIDVLSIVLSYTSYLKQLFFFLLIASQHAQIHRERNQKYKINIQYTFVTSGIQERWNFSTNFLHSINNFKDNLYYAFFCLISHKTTIRGRVFIAAGSKTSLNGRKG